VQGTDNYSCGFFALDIEDNNHPNDKRLHMNPEQNILKVTKSTDNENDKGPLQVLISSFHTRGCRTREEGLTGLVARMLNVTVAHPLQ